MTTILADDQKSEEKGRITVKTQHLSNSFYKRENGIKNLSQKGNVAER